MTKFQRGLYQNFLIPAGVSIFEVYERPSRNKVKAYEDCLRRANENGADYCCIPTHNTFNFTFAYTFHKDGVKWLHYETACNVYEFPIV